jgi:hypothetical protein
VDSGDKHLPCDRRTNRFDRIIRQCGQEQLNVATGVAIAESASPYPRHPPVPQLRAVHPEQCLADEQRGREKGELDEEAAFALSVKADGDGEFERVLVGLAVAQRGKRERGDEGA